MEWYKTYTQGQQIGKQGGTKKTHTAKKKEDRKSIKKDKNNNTRNSNQSNHTQKYRLESYWSKQICKRRFTRNETAVQIAPCICFIFRTNCSFILNLSYFSYPRLLSMIVDFYFFSHKQRGEQWAMHCRLHTGASLPQSKYVTVNEMAVSNAEICQSSFFTVTGMQPWLTTTNEALWTMQLVTYPFIPQWLLHLLCKRIDNGIQILKGHWLGSNTKQRDRPRYLLGSSLDTSMSGKPTKMDQETSRQVQQVRNGSND